MTLILQYTWFCNTHIARISLSNVSLYYRTTEKLMSHAIDRLSHLEKMYFLPFQCTDQPDSASYWEICVVCLANRWLNAIWPWTLLHLFRSIWTNLSAFIEFDQTFCQTRARASWCVSNGKESMHTVSPQLFVMNNVSLDHAFESHPMYDNSSMATLFAIPNIFDEPTITAETQNPIRMIQISLCSPFTSTSYSTWYIYHYSVQIPHGYQGYRRKYTVCLVCFSSVHGQGMIQWCLHMALARIEDAKA